MTMTEDVPTLAETLEVSWEAGFAYWTDRLMSTMGDLFDLCEDLHVDRPLLSLDEYVVETAYDLAQNWETLPPSVVTVMLEVAGFLLRDLEDAVDRTDEWPVIRHRAMTVRRAIKVLTGMAEARS